MKNLSNEGKIHVEELGLFLTVAGKISPQLW